MKKGKKEAPVAQHEGGNDYIPFETEESMSVQIIIDLFSQQFKHILESPDLQEFIQVVKGQLYERQYLAAFDTDDKRFAYASRWTPARALSYSSLFASLEPITELLREPEATKKALLIGGGACGEVVGLSSVFCRLKEYNSKSDSNLEMHIVDIADWSKIVTNLTNHMKSNWVYNQNNLNSYFYNQDILEENSFAGLQDIDLITLMFTTNELFAEKRAATIRFLQTLNQNCKQGSLLLITESAGSYSHITVGTKRFPVQFIIDTILLGKDKTNGPWDLIESSDSCWYRIVEKDVHYPVKLENMRFFYRLYRKK